MSLRARFANAAKRLEVKRTDEDADFVQPRNGSGYAETDAEYRETKITSLSHRKKLIGLLPICSSVLHC